MLNSLFDEADRASNSTNSAAAAGDDDLSVAKAPECKRGRFCRNIPFCRICSARYAASAEEDICAYIDEVLPTEEDQRRSLVFVTCLEGACELGDHSRVRELQKRAQTKLKTLTDRFPPLFKRGKFEIEIFRLAECDHRKNKVLRELLRASGIENPVRGRSYGLVHFHAVLGIRDIEIDDLKRALKRRYKHVEYQSKVQHFYKDKDIFNSVHDISKYMFKKQTHYKTRLNIDGCKVPISEEDVVALDSLNRFLVGSNSKGMIIYSKSKNGKSKQALQQSKLSIAGVVKSSRKRHYTTQTR